VIIFVRDEAGKNFYNELAQSVYQISRELLNRYHGIASLVDVFYITNEKRKICNLEKEFLINSMKSIDLTR